MYNAISKQKLIIERRVWLGKFETTPFLSYLRTGSHVQLAERDIKTQVTQLRHLFRSVGVARTLSELFQLKWYSPSL